MRVINTSKVKCDSLCPSMLDAKDPKREVAVRMIREGRDNAEISDATGLSIGQIAAYRAHYTMGKYGALIDSKTEEIEEIKEAVEATFSLERDLQAALRSNIEQLESGLRVVDGGSERRVSFGRIDITAEDKEGSIVVIELKAGEADRDAIGQLLSYMGQVVETVARPVRGILVAGSFSARAISAARVLANVELKAYSFKFFFNSVKAER